jgi:transposase-like protein
MEHMENTMRWIAIAATAENDVIAAHDDMVLLETVSEYDFDAIIKVYGVNEQEYQSLKQGSYNYRIRYNNLRSTYLEPWERDARIQRLSAIYTARINAINGIKGRVEHALNKHRTTITHQTNVYEAKAREAEHIRDNSWSPYRQDGFVRDYAEETGIDIDTAAAIVLMKYDGWYQYMRKIERMRLRHFNAVKIACTEDDFKAAAAALDKDLFTNMLL